MDFPLRRRLINDIAAAGIIGQSPGTLRKWRITGKGPRFIKLHSTVRYDQNDLDDFLESRKVFSTAEAEKLGARKPGRPKKIAAAAALPSSEVA